MQCSQTTHTKLCRGFDSDALGAWFGNAIDEAGLPDECVMHGLRKTMACTLAEVGSTPHEIAAITGHKSPRGGRAVFKVADRKRLAAAGIHRLERKRRDS